MRFNLIDLFFAIACGLIGVEIGLSLSPQRPWYARPVAAPLGGLGMYLALVYPFYRGLKLYPLILPRCPCCRRFQEGFHTNADDWPRVRFRCPTCNGEFIIWHNGKPGNQETWETPVLTLNWPYAWGIYKRAKRLEQRAAPNVGSADAPPKHGESSRSKVNKGKT